MLLYEEESVALPSHTGETRAFERYLYPHILKDTKTRRFICFVPEAREIPQNQGSIMLEVKKEFYANWRHPLPSGFRYERICLSLLDTHGDPEDTYIIPVAVRR